MSDYGTVGRASIRRQPAKKPRRRWVVPTVAILVVLALVAGLGVWAYATDRWPFNPSSGSYRDLGTTGVGVNKDAPKNITAVADKQAKPQFKQIQPLGDVTHITPDGGQTTEITLRFKLSSKVADPADVLIAFSKTGKPGSWELVAPAEVSKDGQYAYVRTTHLSWWQPILRSVTELVDAVLAELKHQFDGLTGDAFAEAEKPKCKDEKSARDKGYSVKWKGAEVLYYCLGLVGGKPVVNIANKRRYPVFINHKGISVPERPKSKLGLEMLARHAFSDNRTVMLPFDQLGLKYELGKGQSKSFATEYNGFAESLYQLEFGITTLLNILTRFGAGGGTISNGAIKVSQFDQVAEKMSDAFGNADCLSAIATDNPNSGEILSSCLNPEQIMRMFGWKGVLLAPVMVVGPVINFFRNSFDTLGDLLSGKDREIVTVGFNPPAAPQVLFKGEWRVHGMNEPIVIDSSLTTTYSSNAGNCPKPGNESNMCDIHVTIKFRVTGKEVMTGTYTKVWYTSEDGGDVPSDLYRELRIAPGKTFTVRRNDAHTLITKDGTGSRPGNPYLCDEYARQRNNTPKYQLCGA